MEFALQLKIGCIFLVLVVSLLGFFAPLSLSLRSSKTNFLATREYCMLKSFSTGIILGVSLLHLLVESIEELGQFWDYPGSFIVEYNSVYYCK
jgi:hypothetical protein